MLVEGKAINLHPLVCTAFNADFDGDQMAVHVPLSLEAQLEARCLMLSTNNVLSPANGQPIIVPSQDVVLGLYYLSIESDGEPGEGMVFSGIDEVRHALAAGAVRLHSKVRARVKDVDESGASITHVVETTPGRVILAEMLPDETRIAFNHVNTILTKKAIGELLDVVYRACGQKESVVFADRIMRLGFEHAAAAGISFGKDDMVIPDNKWDLIEEAQNQVKTPGCPSGAASVCGSTALGAL